MLRRNCAALEASRTKSNSSCRYLSNSCTTSRGFKRRPSSFKRSIQPAIMCIKRKSLSMTCSMPGRSTFTATSCSTPSRSRIRAKCTCAIEALATGSRSKCTNSSDKGLRKERSIVVIATSAGNGGTRSCNNASSCAMSGGNKSRRVDMTCPNFTKMGPKRSNAKRKRTPRGCLGLRPNVSTRPNQRKPRCGAALSSSSSKP